MKRKFITNTYLKDVSKYQLKMYLDEDDCYIAVKKLIKLDKKLILKNGTCVMDEGYYVLEIVPKYENYVVRFFINESGNVIERYIDITKNNGLDIFTKVPFYDDLYLDIVVSKDGEINVLDKDELDEALKENSITNIEYELIMKVKDELIKEIKDNSNKYMNINVSKYLF